MQKQNRLTGFKSLALVLAMTLLLPSAVKFSHIFSHHHHEVCNGELAAHLHRLDLDCKFYAFKLHTPFTVPSIEFEFSLQEDNHQIHSTNYSFLSHYEALHFSLRGPPQINFI